MTKLARQRAALRGWKTRRAAQAARKIARAQTATTRLSIGDMLGWVEGVPTFVVVGIDWHRGVVTLNCADGS